MSPAPLLWKKAVWMPAAGGLDETYSGRLLKWNFELNHQPFCVK